MLDNDKVGQAADDQTAADMPNEGKEDEKDEGQE